MASHYTPPDGYMTVREVAAARSCRPNVVYRAISSGTLQAKNDERVRRRRFGIWIVRREDAAKWVNDAPYQGRSKIDRAEVARVIREDGRDAALLRWSEGVVREAALAHGLEVRRNVLWKKSWDRLLGTASDAVVAARTGATRVNVGAHRRALGIESYRPPAGSVSPKRTLADATNEELETLPWTVLRSKYGCGKFAVQAERSHRGILRGPGSRVAYLRKIAVKAMVADGATLSEVGEALGVSRQRAAQINRALAVEPIA